MESEVETGETYPAYPIRFLVGGDPSIAEEIPAEGIILFSFSPLLFSLFHIYTFIMLIVGQNIGKRVAEDRHPEEPLSTKQKLDEVITSQQSGSIDLMAFVDRCLEGPHYNFDEVISSSMYSGFYISFSLI